ncbi:GNAT family N-acetyltransferase [Pseudochrobactrum sp. MP213Fo]|uniref:GNAT family N-acetyltransferase n=1 Tax=Pseudochrobactrum sp. MP213Fo TaxID=3022250 RepID=UPI003B9FEBDA
MGSLIVRIADNPETIRIAQKLRYDVFYTELGAQKSADTLLEQRDADHYDAICDHLVVYDTAIAGGEAEQLIGTYRLMRSDMVMPGHSFYSAGEYDINKLISRKPDLQFLELGRSCVKPEYRSKRTVELLWQGIWSYCRNHKIEVMFGCASFHGTVPEAHALSLSFLQHNCRADAEWDVRALDQHYRSMDMMPPEGINPKVALFSMPPLIKGYLRLGAMIGDGAVVDHQFSTTDVLIVLPVERISSRYINYYGAEADRFI